jgi:hypothetical protein
MLAWIVFISIFLLPVAYLCGRFTAKYAVAKGRSERAWFLWGALLFPLFPLPWMVLELLPSRGRQMAVNPN